MLSIGLLLHNGLAHQGLLLILVILFGFDECVHVFFKHDEGLEEATLRDLKALFLLIGLNGVDIGQGNSCSHNFI